MKTAPLKPISTKLKEKLRAFLRDSPETQTGLKWSKLAGSYVRRSPNSRNTRTRAQKSIVYHETWTQGRAASGFRRGCPNFGVSRHSQIIKQPLLSSCHNGEENLENVTQMLPIWWCLFVFASSPKWCTTTGGVLTPGLYFKCQSCYLLLCSSNHVEKEKKKPIWWKPKTKFPTVHLWGKLPSKGVEDATLGDWILIARDAPTVT